MPATRAAAVLTVALALSACTTTPARTSPPEAVAAGQADPVVRNHRPPVSYDGLMVRRRVVIAIHATPGSALPALRRQLDLAATRRHMTLSTISAGVLDPATLERLAPDLVVALPADATVADAGMLIDPALDHGRRLADEIQEFTVVSVLVHDLRFTVDADDPAALSRAVAREGILADALGTYSTTFSTHQLQIAYTGPLLSDFLIESVRRGIARPAVITPQTITVSPRSTTGIGVDMASEPAPPAAATQATTGHNHSPEPPTGTRPSRP